MKTILITGSNGLLGQKLIKKLRGQDQYHLIASSKGKNRIKDKSGYDYENLDITDRSAVMACFEKYQIDTIINTAAMTNVDLCEENKIDCWTLNVDAVRHLNEAAEKHDSHFIHLSTDFVFDGKNGPYKEEDAPNPLSYYGESKLASEEILLASKAKTTIVRTMLVYGISEDMSRSNIILWAKSALEKNEVLKIVNDQFRCPTLAEDLADGCILILEKEVGGIFHISGKDFMSIDELVRKVAKHYDLNADLIEEVSSKTLNQKAKRPPKTGFKLDKSRKILNYQPHSFEEGMTILDNQL